MIHQIRAQVACIVYLVSCILNPRCYFFFSRPVRFLK